MGMSIVALGVLFVVGAYRIAQSIERLADRVRDAVVDLKRLERP